MHGFPYVFDGFESRLGQNGYISKHRHQMDQYWSPDNKIGVDRELISTAFDRRQFRLERSRGGPVRGHIKIAFFGSI